MPQNLTFLIQASRVLIKRIERTKRKCVTTIYGLDIFGVDLKKAAKMFANRFACGSSVAKNNQGQDEIVVQGDFSDELLKMILKNWTNVSLLFFFYFSYNTLITK